MSEAIERNNRKERVGVVVSDKMDKTIVVAIKDKAKHPLYKKTINKTKKTQGSRREKRVRHRRYRSYCRDQTPFQGQVLETC